MGPIWESVAIFIHKQRFSKDNANFINWCVTFRQDRTSDPIFFLFLFCIFAFILSNCCTPALVCISALLTDLSNFESSFLWNIFLSFPYSHLWINFLFFQNVRWWILVLTKFVLRLPLKTREKEKKWGASLGKGFYLFFFCLKFWF